MKLSQYIGLLQKMLAEHGDVDVVRRTVSWRVSEADEPEASVLHVKSTQDSMKTWSHGVHKDSEKGEVVIEI